MCSVKYLYQTDAMCKSHTRKNLLQNSNPKRVIWYGCVGLELFTLHYQTDSKPSLF